jgi:fumarylacetoacetase
MIDETHNPARVSWVESANGHPEFPIQNLPLGVFSPIGGGPRAGTAIGDKILDLRALAAEGLLDSEAAEVLGGETLNPLFGLPAAPRRALRRRLSDLLSDARRRAAVEPLLYAAAPCTLALPAAIGDYTDFYVGIHHAENVGRQFRPENPLLANYKHVPIGYHGRASSVRPSGVPVIRPRGQTKPPEAGAPGFGPTRRLDYELELGVWIGPGNALGAAIPIADAPSHVVGLCLLNDWSARDIQAWEYQPLGPFLAKSFQTTVSPWVVTVEALAPFRIPQPPRPAGDPRPLDYLWNDADQSSGAFAIELEVSLLTARMGEAGLPPQRLSRTEARHMYWTVAQMLTHHASNGCNLNPGDLLGTGTVSAPDPTGLGSLLELTRGGAASVSLPGGETRAFLEDGDAVLISAKARAPGAIPIGFGACKAAIQPAAAAAPAR